MLLSGNLFSLQSNPELKSFFPLPHSCLSLSTATLLNLMKSLPNTFPLWIAYFLNKEVLHVLFTSISPVCRLLPCQHQLLNRYPTKKYLLNSFYLIFVYGSSVQIDFLYVSIDKIIIKNSHSSQIIQWEVFKIICHEPIAIFLPLFTSVDTDENSGTALGDVQLRTSSIKSLQNAFPKVFLRETFYVSPSSSWKTKNPKGLPLLLKSLFIRVFPLPHYRNPLPPIFCCYRTA